MKKIFFLIMMFAVGNVQAQTQMRFEPADTVKINEIAALQKSYDFFAPEISFDSSFLRTYKYFIATPYVAHTLEGKPETLTINLRQLDCTTFVESLFCIAYLNKTESPKNLTFKKYAEMLQKIRYRCGIVDGYASRIHYFEDWIATNEEKGFVRDITKEIGGVEFVKNINFMTKNRDKYPSLADQKTFEQIKISEKNINKQKHFYIPKEKILYAEKYLKDGDIIAITTNVDGLDIAHVGFAIKQNDGHIHFLHAPNVGSKVMISENPLHDYIAGNKRFTGIMVARCK